MMQKKQLAVELMYGSLFVKTARYASMLKTTIGNNNEWNF